MIPDFQRFIAVDWSGARGPRLPGLQVAGCRKGRGAPSLVLPRRAATWSRQETAEYILRAAHEDGPVLAGFDFGLAFPFRDAGAYFPGGRRGGPATPAELWKTVDKLSEGAPDWYAGPFCAAGQPFAEYMNAPGHRGARFDMSRHRLTEHHCRKWTRPSSVFNGVGAGSVGMGSLAGMRMLHALAGRPGVAIWPFHDISDARLVIVEIFPRFYVKLAGMDPRTWRKPGFLSRLFRFYRASPGRGQAWRGLSEDATDALLSAAALRELSRPPEVWHPRAMIRSAATREGWIFGVY